jgi:carbon-monoxide dehydrogenase large subunit
MIGSSPRRKEDQRLLTGHGRYVDDLTREGTLHLGVVRSTEAHARLTKVATAAARAMPGVALAGRAADLGGIAPNMPTAYGGTQKGRAWAQPVLARDVVRHVGEPVAVVVAESLYQLADALDAVTVAYEPLPALPTAESALASGARLHEGWPDNTAVVARGAVGDPERAMAGAHLVVRERLRHPRLSAVPIETRGVFAYRDRAAGTLVVSSDPEPVHAPGRRRRGPRSAGRRSPRHRPRRRRRLRAEGADLSRGDPGRGRGARLGRPVKWIESRRESLACMGHDREQNHDARIGFARDGTIVAIDATFVADVGAYPLQGDGLTANTVNHLPGPYRVRTIATPARAWSPPRPSTRGIARPGGPRRCS